MLDFNRNHLELISRELKNINLFNYLKLVTLDIGINVKFEISKSNLKIRTYVRKMFKAFKIIKHKPAI